MKQGYYPPQPPPQPAQQQVYHNQPTQQNYQQAYQQQPQYRAQSRQKAKQSERRNILLLLSSIYGIIYAIIMIVYFLGVTKQSFAPGTEDFEEMGRQIGGAIAVALATPHIIGVSLAAVFNAVAWYFNKGWAALTAAILYLVAGIIFFIYLPFILIPMVLAFIGFIRVNNRRNRQRYAQPNY